MILNLFNKDDAIKFHYGSLAKYIQDLRAAHLAQGGDPIDFPQYLKEAGIEMDGPLVVIKDEFALMAKLKYSK